MAEHKFLFLLVIFASLASLGWILIIYVLSFHAARRIFDGIDTGYEPPRRDLLFARFRRVRSMHDKMAYLG
jgi:hypothetical protein